MKENHPAFPYSPLYQQGMSKRFYAACAAMQDRLSNPETVKNFYNSINTVGHSVAETVLVSSSYAWADELLNKKTNDYTRKI